MVQYSVVLKQKHGCTIAISKSGSMGAALFLSDLDELLYLPT
jgi:hypothetical protein